MAALSTAKRLVSYLPANQQAMIRRWHICRQFKKGNWHAGEPEFDCLREWVKNGDTVIDVGANVGHYTCELSALAGPTGRVISVEPIPEAFLILTQNVGELTHSNVTLLNCALSTHSAFLKMSVPNFETGLSNLYRANLVTNGEGIDVCAICGDQLDIPGPVSLIKIDVEGHELEVVTGFKETICRDFPRLIIENAIGPVEDFLVGIGYDVIDLPNSPNRVFFKD